MQKNVNKTINTVETDLEQRRKFLEKFGKLAVITPVALTALMSPSTSAAPKSCKNGGSNGKGCR
ncbi:hypothetical protein [Thalassotalea ganghwensis]